VDYVRGVPNRLAQATSPYLLQHKDNPVEWHEWGEAAFAEARQRDVPLLLSVGYSACHWCHVMAHESFEDPDTAAEMNRRFVNVKVDREERPDVDSVYMEAVQAMTGHGGWPMTVWLAPDGRPFYAGTYFPNTDRHGMPSFLTVIGAVSDAWAGRREEIVAQSERLTAAIKRSIPVAESLPDESVLRSGYDSLAGAFDPINGGFGTAPKFPQQPVLEFLLRVHREEWAPRAGHMVQVTLSEMADGGIHDQIGGGFSRYSVDAQWLVPHFEKMLYDNAQLARLYLWAGIELDQPRFIEVARSTLGYLAGDLRHPDGGFFSAEDADSEGVEGKFYVWGREELREVLGEEDAAEAARFFGATPHGNFEGSNILHRPTSEPWTDHLESIRSRLLERRSTRVRPGLDDKVIASWNGLAIRAFAEAGAALDDRGYLDLARAAAAFVLDRMMVAGELHRSWRDGRIGVGAYLEDYGAVAQGLFTLYAATGEYRWFAAGRDLAERVASRFLDPDGGFFDTPDDGPELIKRPKSQTDNPLPSGNALAAEALLTLAAYTGHAGTKDLSLSALKASGLLMSRFPSMVGHHMSVLHSLGSWREVAIVGAEWPHLARVVWRRFRPHVVLAPSHDASEPIPLLQSRSVPGSTLAYVCQDHVCSLPTEEPAALEAQLDEL
jgi:uncharacterized protein YyaL (SSP411 family)